MPLAWLFPSVFAGSKTAASNPYESGEASRDRGHNWQPYTGSSKTEGLNHSSIHRSDNTSEEYILDSVDSESGSRQGKGEFGAIRKTTKYKVSYEQGVESRV